MIDVASAATTRADQIRRSMKRHGLVFVQLAAVFDPLRESLLRAIGGHQAGIAQRSLWIDQLGEDDALVVVGLEDCTSSTENVLGEVREIVFHLLDSGRQVCLTSRAPRIAYQSVPGSSILEDSAFVMLPLLTRDELSLAEEEYPPMGWQWPVVALGDELTSDSFMPALSELGQELVAALDHALFEVNPKGAEGIEFLTPREVEGLRGSGLLEVAADGAVSLVTPGAIKLLREAVSTHVSDTVDPVAMLATVTAGLWYVERRIRNEVRAAAIAQMGSTWRATCLGGLASEVLKRAQLDGAVAAKSVADLRDPLEWLTLGELMDLVRSATYSNLGVEPAIWRKLQEQLVPVRNRVAHVRMLKSGDDEIVTMWATLVRSRFGR